MSARGRGKWVQWIKVVKGEEKVSVGEREGIVGKWILGHCVVI